MAMKHEVNTPVILVTGLISLLFLGVVVIALHAWYLSAEQAEVQLKSADAPVLALETLKLDQKERINSYRWVDRDKQIVAIPIDQAMNLLIQNRGQFPTTQPR